MDSSVNNALKYDIFADRLPVVVAQFYFQNCFLGVIRRKPERARCDLKTSKQLECFLSALEKMNVSGNNKFFKSTYH